MMWQKPKVDELRFKCDTENQTFYGAKLNEVKELLQKVGIPGTYDIEDRQRGLTITYFVKPGPRPKPRKER